ncbi:hypothetical protein BLNAU_24884 [Blattamonas nauphoetae]|uniref:Uncharacterized protein n=1 Tax=Blattamonas nauphoetae TaxID=2049346 RepID=A0ABQ9WL65_9EUKA|nr:hypothetical protein BLNAU_24884 [Blattamonas nauphoetae]
MTHADLRTGNLKDINHPSGADGESKSQNSSPLAYPFSVCKVLGSVLTTCPPHILLRSQRNLLYLRWVSWKAEKLQFGPTESSSTAACRGERHQTTCQCPAYPASGPDPPDAVLSRGKDNQR